MLSLIAKESLTTDEIYRRMLANYEIDEDDELLEAIEQVSALLERLGVISSKA